MHELAEARLETAEHEPPLLPLAIVDNIRFFFIAGVVWMATAGSEKRSRR